MDGSTGSDIDRLVGELAAAKGEIVQLRQRLAELEAAGDGTSSLDVARMERDRASEQLDDARTIASRLHALIVQVRDVATVDDVAGARFRLGQVAGLLENVAPIDELLGDAGEDTKEDDDGQSA